VINAELVLQDGRCFPGALFGATRSVAGEVVFNTGMVGYPESLTDPSYSGQILVFTHPLIGNYGVPIGAHGPAFQKRDALSAFESDRVRVKGVVVSTLSGRFSHWSAPHSLEDWMSRQGIPGICGVDTRALTKHLRLKGSMLGKIVTGAEDVPWDDPNQRNLVAEVSTPERIVYGSGERRVVLVDLGCKHSIIRSLLRRNLTVVRVPWNADFSRENADGIVLSNGPGDPKMCVAAIEQVRQAMRRHVPIFGICLGHQLLCLAAGGDTYKLKFGHRSQNQPCLEVGSKRCYITSQNHGYAVDEQTLDGEWLPWFFNANDGTNEGIRHRSEPFFSVQFHPEAQPGPMDTDRLFDRFAESLPHVHQAA
jgi:carbamoyl-phosphate synthase small subunit